jgi:hypothetical protein
MAARGNVPAEATTRSLIEHWQPDIVMLEESPVPCRAELPILETSSTTRPAEELDSLVADLFARPTVAAAGRSGAAQLLYEPKKKS